jgi:hypothetical protein
VAQQRSIQLGQISNSCSPNKQRMNAQRVAVTTGMRQAPNVLGMRGGNRWNHAEANARLPRAFAHGQHISAELGRV